jgi:hypothetical protein
MKIILITVFLMLSFTVSADLHKCVINGKTAYTEKQCPSPEAEKKIDKGGFGVLDNSEQRQVWADAEEKAAANRISQEQQRSDLETAKLMQMATQKAETFEEKRQQKAAIKLLESKQSTYTSPERAELIQKATQKTDTTFEGIRQQKAALKILTGTSAPQSEKCSSDYSCGVGYKCVKAPVQVTGVCMKDVNQNSAKDPNSVLPNMSMEGCFAVGSGCPSGFHCDIKLKACVK